MNTIHREIQLLKQHLDADQKALERILERCQIHESNLEDALSEIQSLRAQINVENFLLERMEKEEMQLKSSSVEEEEVVVVVRDTDTPLQHEEEQQLADKHHQQDKLELTRQVPEERKSGSLILRRLCEKRGIVLSRALEKLWHENKSIQKASEKALENGSDLNAKLKAGQDGNKELVVANRCRLNASRPDVSGLRDRNRDLKISLASQTKRNLNMQKKIHDLERQVQSLRDLVAQKEVEIYVAAERLKGEREKNEDLAKWIVGLGSEDARLRYRMTASDVTISSEKKDNSLLREEVQAMKNTVAELEDENAELKMVCRLAIWILELTFVILLFYWL